MQSKQPCTSLVILAFGDALLEGVAMYLVQNLCKMYSTICDETVQICKQNLN